MKKLAILLAVVACSAAQAQTSFSHKGVTFGVRAGVNFSTMLEKAPANPDDKFFGQYLTGFNAGISIGVPFMKWLGLESGLYFTTKGAMHKQVTDIYTRRDMTEPMYVELPVRASFRFALPHATGLYVNAGPYFAVGVGGKNRWKSTFEGGTRFESAPLFGKNAEGFKMKRCDAGVGFGAGVTFRKFCLGLNYSVGVINVHKGRRSFYNSSFSIETGYNF